MHIVGLAASPRLNSNSELLLDALLAGAQAGGAEVEKIRLAEADIHACVGCELCSLEGVCQFDDRANEIFTQLLAADVVVLATPVYFYSVTTQAKLLIDRAQALWARHKLQSPADDPPRGRAVLLAVGASNGDRLFDGIVLTVRYFVDTLHKDLTDKLFFRNVDQKRAILAQPEALAQARALGESLAANKEQR